MKTNRFLLAIATTVLAASLMVAQASAQRGEGGPRPGMGGGPGGPGGQRGGNRMLDMDKKILDGLKLTADQTAKVKALKTKVGDKMKAMRAKMGPPPGGPPAGGPPAGGPPKMDDAQRQKMRAAMQGIRKEYTDGLAKILTKAQKATYDAQMKAEMDKMRAQFGGGGMRGGNMGGRGPRGG